MPRERAAVAATTIPTSPSSRFPAPSAEAPESDPERESELTVRQGPDPSASYEGAAIGDTGVEEVEIEEAAGGWVDRLVELRVLAEHGDTAAAAQAEEWLSNDEAAGRIWHQMTRDCSLLDHL